MSAIAPTHPALTHVASAADPGTVQGTAALLMLKKGMQQQAAMANQLLEALPQPALASSGTLGTKVNTYA